MHVLLLSDDMLAAGVPRYIGDLANGLICRGIRVTVAATDGPFRRRLGEDVPFVPLTICQPGSTRRAMGGVVKSFRALSKLVQNEKFDVIHTQKRFTDALGRVLARRTGALHVSTCHNTFSNRKALSLFGDYTIAVSDSIARLLTKDFAKLPSRVKTVYYGCPPLRIYSQEQVSAARMRLGISPAMRVIGSIGHLSKVKDRPTLLRALSALKSRGELKDVLVVIAGTGGQEQAVRNLIDDLDLQRIVQILPDITDVTDLCNIADFFVLSSVQEGLPYVLLEAASLSKPHVATNVGGVGEFIRNGETGLLVPPGAPKELAAAIGYLLDNREDVQRLGINAKRRFEENHSYEQFIGNTISFYRSALQAPDIITVVKR